MPTPFFIPTPATPQQQTTDAINKDLSDAFGQIQFAYNDVQNLIFSNRFSLTPAQVAAALGTNGAAIFAWAATFAPLINANLPDGQQPVVVVPDGHTMAANPDNTVTLT
jgi:hypothetical protein